MFKTRLFNKWDCIEDPQINPHIYQLVDFQPSFQNTQICVFSLGNNVEKTLNAKTIKLLQKNVSREISMTLAWVIIS